MKENFVAPDYVIHKCFCGSFEVGGSMGSVYCYKCGLTIKRPGHLQNSIDAWNEIHENAKQEQLHQSEIGNDEGKT